MVLVDDVLMLPLRGLVWIARQVQNAAQEELVGEADSITAELSNLYMRLETGRISEEEFAADEKTLLERLDRLQEPEKSLEGTQSGSTVRVQRKTARAA